MAENKLLFLKNAFPKYDVQFLEDFTKAIIFNPFYDENITVYYYEDDDFTPYCVCFSFQHCHLTDEEDVLEWINDIIGNRKFAIEFFKDGRDCFGFEIESKQLIDLSYEKLEQFSGYYGLTKLLEIADTFKVRGWDNQHNFDAVFYRDEMDASRLRNRKRSCSDSQCVKKVRICHCEERSDVTIFCCGTQNLLLAIAHQILTAATPY